ncbi:uncharacterized protein LOC132939345 [Metopolophium dirhodum]|uniref:uncharacterized protein LOC132939345 n=1 Tax=Metopolophium dirhodum TaxID=44670 RepID=UPI00298F7C70|nr:uncharacterized protein LOC132939345 [Metopolophium dirhodum]
MYYVRYYIDVCFLNLQVIYQKMQNIIEKMKCVLELKSKISTSEEQVNKLQEYVKMLKDMIHKSSNFPTLISNVNSAIDEVEKSLLNIKKAIAVLELEKKVEIKSTAGNAKLVLNMKKVLSELYNKNFELLIQKENRLLELKSQIKEFNATYNISKEKQELDCYIKEYDLLKAKNIHLKEMISFNIEN